MIFPTGVEQFVIGGLFVGLGISFIYLFTGKVAGASTFFTSTWGYISNRPFFQKEKFVSSRGWRIVLAASLLFGGFLYILLFNSGQRVETQVQWWRLLLGGTLAGIGTRMAGGCPSGHGICGLSSLDKTSLYAVLIFLSIAMGVAVLVKSLGVVP